MKYKAMNCIKTAIIAAFTFTLMFAAGCSRTENADPAVHPVNASPSGVVSPAASAPVETLLLSATDIASSVSPTIQALPEIAEEDVNAARSVVTDYFHAVEAKDKAAVIKTMTDRNIGPSVSYFGDETRKLLDILYDSQDIVRAQYVQPGMAGYKNGATIGNVIVFKVSFEVTLPSGSEASPYDEGVYKNWNIILVRKDSSQPWLIDDQGY
jgi:hypothetical protein